MHIKKIAVPINFIIFQVCWFACVTGAAKNLVWLGPTRAHREVARREQLSEWPAARVLPPVVITNAREVGPVIGNDPAVTVGDAIIGTHGRSGVDDDGRRIINHRRRIIDDGWRNRTVSFANVVMPVASGISSVTNVRELGLRAINIRTEHSRPE